MKGLENQDTLMNNMAQSPQRSQKEQAKIHKADVSKLLNMVQEQNNQLNSIEKKFKAKFKEIKNDLKRVKTYQLELLKKDDDEDEINATPQI